MIFLLIRGNIMDNEENIDDLIEKVRNSYGWEIQALLKTLNLN